MSASRRIGVYGGTFDPVHRGHVEIARRILALFELDEVIFVPAYVAPHKAGAGVASPFHRFAMLALATEDEKQLRVSTLELDAPERPYTVETIARMREQFGDKTRLFFIMGADSWGEIATWRDWERLLQSCDHIVVTRPGYELNPGPGVKSAVDVRGLADDSVRSSVNERPGPDGFFTDAVRLDISATEIRAAARAGDRGKLDTLVPARVVDYIEKHQLYQNL